MLRSLTRASYVVDRACRWAAVGFFSLMLVIVLFQVVARYIFQSVPVWTAEAARYCMVWGGFLGATVAFWSEADPRLVQPPRTGQRWWIISAFWIRAVGTIVFLGPVLYFSPGFLARTWVRTTEALGIPTAIVTFAVPLMVGIIFFHLLVRIVNMRTETRSRGEPADPP
jgi:TRAP-type C4-dicarboxylate transport system permease small subunit